MNINDLKISLTDADCTEKTKEYILKAYQNGQTDSALKWIKMDRGRLLEELHEYGRKVDIIDYLIKKLEKELEQKSKQLGGKS